MDDDMQKLVNKRSAMTVKSMKKMKAKTGTDDEKVVKIKRTKKPKLDTARTVKRTGKHVSASTINRQVIAPMRQMMNWTEKKAKSGACI
jgi:hypothetical protein